MAQETKKKTTPVNQKKGWVKWASRIGKFLMYGGWMAVAVLVVVVSILISTLTKC